MIPRGWLLAAALAVVVLARPAFAFQNEDDSGVNLHQIYLPLDGHGFYVVDDPQTLEQWQAHGFLNYSHAYRPLESGAGASSSRLRGDIVDRQDMLDVGGSLGLLPAEGYYIHGLSVGFDIPVNIINDGLQLPLDQKSIGSGGVGALRLQIKADILELAEEGETAPKGEKSDEADKSDKSDKNHRSLAPEPENRPFWTLSFGAKPFATFPTGRTREYLNDRDAPTWGCMFESAIKVWRFRLGLEGGYEFTQHLVLGDLNIRDRVRWGSALEFFILDDQEFGSRLPEQSRKELLRHTAAVGFEAFGWADAFHFFEDPRTRPVEGFAYLRYENSLGLQLSIGYGYGLNHGVGAPQDRLMMRIGFTF